MKKRKNRGIFFGDRYEQIKKQMKISWSLYVIAVLSFSLILTLLLPGSH